MPWMGFSTLGDDEPARLQARVGVSDAQKLPLTRTIYPDYWWDDELWKSMQRADGYRHVLDAIKLSDPPDPAGTRKELDALLSLEDRDDFRLRIPEIIEENEGPPAYYRRMLFLDPQRRPLTGAIFRRMIV